MGVLIMLLFQTHIRTQYLFVCQCHIPAAKLNDCILATISCFGPNYCHPHPRILPKGLTELFYTNTVMLRAGFSVEVIPILSSVKVD